MTARMQITVINPQGKTSQTYELNHAPLGTDKYQRSLTAAANQQGIFPRFENAALEHMPSSILILSTQNKFMPIKGQPLQYKSTTHEGFVLQISIPAPTDHPAAPQTVNELLNAYVAEQTR